MAEYPAGRRTQLTVNISLFPPEGKTAPAIRAYLFDAAGRLVSSSPAGESVTFDIDPAQRYRVTVGPDLVHDRKSPPADLAAQLSKSGAVSRDYAPHSDATTISIVVRENLIVSWLRICINIHGTVRKLLNPGADSPNYAPICTGIVQIFTIDLACSLGHLSNAQLLALRTQMLSRMLGVEIADVITGNLSGFAQVSALAAGLAPLTGQPLRNYIVAHRAELAAFMCNLISEGYICYQQLPDAPIQSDGTFSLDYCFFVWQAPPDVYFEVVQTIDGMMREVADPDILCTTIWGYDGSQGAVITVEDPTAVACLPALPGPDYPYVWPTAIGNIPLSQINGLEMAGGTGLLPGNTPWGGTLCLQVQFDPNLGAHNIRYYRWSYRFDGDADFTQINASVTHRWQEITMSGGVINIHLHPYTFGPQMHGGNTNLFEVPDPTKEWIDIVDPSDRPFAYFDSTGGQTPGRSGMVTLKLEMFDNTGAHVSSNNVNPAGMFTYILPDLGGPPDSYTNAPAFNIDANGDLVFRVLVDNNPTTAQLPIGITVSGNIADACGILHYGSTSDIVSIPYIASHPNNYLDWSLSVTRGASVAVPPGASGHTSANSHYDQTAGALLGGCSQAAFAVNLYCAARAESGYGRQSQYDRSATSAFALLTEPS
jgi:hypothetical protein